MKRLLHFAAASLLSLSAANAERTHLDTPSEVFDIETQETNLDKDVAEMIAMVLTAMPEGDDKVRYETLTEEDFQIVAKELGVEVAAIKAVVKIEAGAKLQGFWAPGVPVANYVQSLFNKYNAKTKGGRKLKEAKVPGGLNGYALKEWTALTKARKINADAADMATYWGMFQIGGFNYKLCDCSSVEEMVAKISDSEFSQLEMFAVFIKNAGMLEALKKKDWAAFARKYNGPAYAKRGYHTRMAKEYANYKKASSSAPSDSETSEVKSQEVESADKPTGTEVSAKSTATTKKKSSTRKKTRRKRKRTTK